MVLCAILTCAGAIENASAASWPCTMKLATSGERKTLLTWTNSSNKSYPHPSHDHCYHTTGFRAILTPDQSLGATCWDASFSWDLLLSFFSITPRLQGSTSRNQLFGIRLEWQNLGKVFSKTTTRQDKGWNAQLQAKAGFLFLLHGGCSLSCTLHNLPHGESQPSTLLHICSHYWRSLVLRCGGQHMAILLAGW